MLPDEYGGQAGKMSVMKEEWRQILKEKRYILELSFNPFFIVLCFAEIILWIRSVGKLIGQEKMVN